MGSGAVGLSPADVAEFVARMTRDAPIPSPRLMRLLYDLLPPADAAEGGT